MSSSPHDKALKMADTADANLQGGKGGRLEGAPLGIKDLFCTEGRADDGMLQHSRRVHADL